MEWILFVLIAGGLLYLGIRQAKKSLAAYESLIARQGLERTQRPCGLTETELADLDVCPEGGRQHGLRFAATGAMTIELGGEPVEVEVAAFQWWWEEHMSQQEGSGQWVEQDQAVAAVRLPVDVPHVTIGQEGRLARWGLGGRDDVQVESEEFNRRFDVADHGTDPDLHGIVAQLPGVRHDAARLASVLPASFLRGLGHA